MLTQVLPNTLPYFKYPVKDVNDPWQKAYRICLQYEAQAATQVNYMRSRVLGYLIREAPNDVSRDTVCHDINYCSRDNDFCDLANGYIRFLVQLFHSSWGPTPSYDLNSPSSDIEETPQSMCKEQAFKRDNYRCVATGTYSKHHHYQDALHEGMVVGALGLAYILPRAINNCSGTDTVKPENTADICIVMQKLGGINPDELSGDKVHRLENVMTLWDPVHSLFDDLDIWFQAEPINDHTCECQVETSYPRESLGFRLPESFTMTTMNPDLPMPSPDYLRLHAACARIAHFSGVAEFVMSLYRDPD